MKVRRPNHDEERLKKKALEEAHSVRWYLVREQPFIGMLLMRLELKTVVDSRLPTACTDGTTIYFNASFLMNLSPPHRLYLMAHEVWHCVFQHFRRRGNRNKKKFNYATDLEIDFMLKKQEFKVFDLLPHKEEWIGKPAEEIYELLPDNYLRPENSDVHIFEGESADDAVIPDGPAEQEESQSSEGGKEGQDGEKREESDAGLKQQANGEGETELVLDPEYVPGVEPGTGRKWRQWIIGAKQQIKRTRGTLPAGVEKLIDDRYQPQLNWRDILQQFVTSCFGGSRQWLPPSRRHISTGLYLPSRKEEFLSVVVAIDTSGSTIDDLPQFLAELKAIISSFGRYEVTMIECDMEIQSVKTFTEMEPFEVEQYSFTGFGGTSFIPVFDHVKEKVEEPRLLIYLTDGYGDAPERPPRYPVLWVLTSDGKAPAEWGEHTRLNQSYSEHEIH